MDLGITMIEIAINLNATVVKFIAQKLLLEVRK